MKKVLLHILIMVLVCILTVTACDSNHQPQTPSDAHIHAFGEWTTVKDATCTENGEQERLCSCGEKESRSILPAHAVVIDAAVSATCQTTGLTEGKHCSACNTIIQPQNIIEKISHVFVNATCKWCNKMDTAAPIITAISLPEQGQALKAGDTLIVNLDITEESDISTCQIVFENSTTGTTINVSSSFTHNTDGKYVITYVIPEDISAGKWVLKSFFIRDKWSVRGNDTIADKSAVFFNVEGTSADTTAPLITAISLSKQGQALKAGDTLIVNLDITEESDISTCQIVFENSTTGTTINVSSSFTHNTDGKYVITYVIPEDISAGKWVLKSFFIRDKWSMRGNDTVADKSAVFFYVQ